MTACKHCGKPIGRYDETGRVQFRGNLSEIPKSSVPRAAVRPLVSRAARDIEHNTRTGETYR